MGTLNQTETFLESEIAKSLKYFEGKTDKYFYDVLYWLHENQIECKFNIYSGEIFVYGIWIGIDSKTRFKLFGKSYKYPLEKLKKKILEMEDELIEDLKSREWQWLK